MHEILTSHDGTTDGDTSTPEQRAAATAFGRVPQREGLAWSTVVKLLCLAVCVVAASFLWQGHKGLSLADEGFLWYGVQRVLLGEVPIRDFMAYDPGRYYWIAGLITLFGDGGIVSVRGALAIFQTLGLFVGLLLVARCEKENRLSIIFWVISAATLMAWMFPRHKLIDTSISIILIGALTQLISKPTPRNYIYAGVCVGLAAIFGRNHGIYGALGSLGVIAWLSLNNRSEPGNKQAILQWSAGLLIGFLPIIFMGLLIPNFAIAFWQNVLLVFELKATNIPLAVPWPWAVNFTSSTIGEAIRGLLIGFFFVGVIAFLFLSIAWVVYRKIHGKTVQPPLVASAFLALPYAHFAFSRADVAHLAQGIFPFLIGCLVILSTAKARIKWTVLVCLCGASFWVMHIFHPGWQCVINQRCVNLEIGSSYLQIDSGTASDINLLRQLAEKYSSNGSTFVAAPFWPGAYALLERKSPMWEIYALFPRPELFEHREIERIEAAKPGFLIINDASLDGRDELRFKNTHPLTNTYIINNFDPVRTTSSTGYRIYKSRDGEK